MSTASTTMTTGRIEITPRPAMPAPQRGGRRPPSDRSGRRRSHALVRMLTPRRYRQIRNGLQFCTVAGLTCLTTVLFLSSVAAAQETTPLLPNLSGTYSCEGDETACGWSGWTFTVTQIGLRSRDQEREGRCRQSLADEPHLAVRGTDLEHAGDDRLDRQPRDPVVERHHLAQAVGAGLCGGCPMVEDKFKQAQTFRTRAGQLRTIASALAQQSERDAAGAARRRVRGNGAVRLCSRAWQS